jgi:hypothetical protein
MRQQIVVRSVVSDGAKLSRNAVLSTSRTTFEQLKVGSTDINFDAWMELYKSDPEEFERCRKAVIQSVIKATPKQHQRRLKGLQFQIDMERRRSDSALQSCMRISSMMWDKFDDMRTTLRNMKEKRGPETVAASEPVERNAGANVLEFSPK